MLTKCLHGLGIGLLASIVAAVLWYSGWLTGFENRTWDWRVKRMADPGSAAKQIRLILLDQNSLDWGSKENGLSWPWPREVYKAVIDFCKRQGAKAIIFDVLFTEPSSMGVSDDEAFGTAIASASNFVGTVFFGTDTGNVVEWPSEIPVPKSHIAGADRTNDIPWLKRSVMPRATFPIPLVATNAALLANVHANPDRDGIYRRVRLFSIFDGKVIPSLGLGAFLVAHPDAKVQIEEQQLILDGHRLPLDRRGNAILHFRGPSQTFKTFSAYSVIQSELRLQANDKEPPPITDPQAFKDCYVFFGFSAPGLYDLRPTPVSGVYPGVEINATILDNLLTQSLMKDSPRTATLLLTILLACLAGLLMALGRSAHDNAITICVALPIPVGICLVAYTNGYWLPLIVQETAVALSVVGTALFNYATEGRQKRFIRSAFKQYLSSEVIEQLVQNPERLTLGGEQRTLSIFFSDLQGFTSISEGLNPQELTALLNDYLTAMTDIIQEEGGTVDKYEGDAIIAFWNAPLSQDDHAVRAVRAALRCQTKLAEMRPSLAERTGKQLFMRIGLNTGPVVVGNMGSHNRFNYTILGDAANLASRLEGTNKQFGTYTMISEATRTQMGEAFPVREISRVIVVGKKIPIRVFEPMLSEQFTAGKADFEVFAQGLKAFYEGRFADAVRILDPLKAKDAASASYVKKCQALLKDPPSSWEGAWVMTEK